MQRANYHSKLKNTYTHTQTHLRSYIALYLNPQTYAVHVLSPSQKVVLVFVNDNDNSPVQNPAEVYQILSSCSVLLAS